MKIYRSLEEAPPDFGPAALTIGNFDGVHYGHRRILRRVRAVARERGLKASALTFDPHPTKVVAPARSPRLLTTPEQRCALMEEEGIEQVLILPFTSELAQLTPEQFVERILIDMLRVRAVFIGDNFRFGHDQAGDAQRLGALGRRWGFTTEVVPAVSMRGWTVSSSALRRLIETGKVTRACRLLGKPYALEGPVVPGHGVGKAQTVPTLNLAPMAEVRPARGVYISRTTDPEAGRSWHSVTNIGYRPTFDGDSALCIETHLIQPLEGGVPRRIHVEFLWRLRDERKFESPAALKAQILRDVARAQAYFRRRGAWTAA